MMTSIFRGAVGRVAAVVVAGCLGAAVAAAPAHAVTYVPISGAGSTWDENALDSWAAQVAANGIKINYAGTGSSDGRNQFRNGTVDFAASEIPYGLTDNGVTDPPPSRPFTYVPILGGGTSFMYHLDYNGRRIDNLRLDGTTVAKIFTGGITVWNDPAIVADNPGITLPAMRITPVVRQDGSGTTAQLTIWMAATNPAIWNAYCASVGRQLPCGTTSFYPVSPTSNFVAASLSTGVAGYVAQNAGEGAITYVEYSYVRNAGFPSAKLLNAGGYYAAPSAGDVEVALTQASFSSQGVADLSRVYTNPDPRAYPLSSVSYLIVPTSTDSGFTTGKGQTLGAFASYDLCQGSTVAGDLGYAPLPSGVITASMAGLDQVPGSTTGSLDLTTCLAGSASNVATCRSPSRATRRAARSASAPPSPRLPRWPSRRAAPSLRAPR